MFRQQELDQIFSLFVKSGKDILEFMTDLVSKMPATQKAGLNFIKPLASWPEDMRGLDKLNIPMTLLEDRPITEFDSMPLS